MSEDNSIKFNHENQVDDESYHAEEEAEDEEIMDDGECTSEHSSIDLEEYLRQRDNIPSDPSDVDEQVADEVKTEDKQSSDNLEQEQVRAASKKQRLEEKRKEKEEEKRKEKGEEKRKEKGEEKRKEKDPKY